MQIARNPYASLCAVTKWCPRTLRACESWPRKATRSLACDRAILPSTLRSWPSTHVSLLLHAGRYSSHIFSIHARKLFPKTQAKSKTWFSRSRHARTKILTRKVKHTHAKSKSNTNSHPTQTVTFGLWKKNNQNLIRVFSPEDIHQLRLTIRYELV